MGAAAQNGFDGRKLADLIALLDSPMEAEAAGALRSIRLLKKKHGGDAPFYELIERPDYKAAVWEKFGEPDCLPPPAISRIAAEYSTKEQMERRRWSTNSAKITRNWKRMARPWPWP